MEKRITYVNRNLTIYLSNKFKSLCSKKMQRSERLILHVKSYC